MKTLLKATAGLLAAGALVGTAPASADASYYMPVKVAKQVAKNRAWKFDGRVESVKVTWFNRWDRRTIHVGVTGEWSTYDSELDWTSTSSCDATVEVHVTRLGRVWSRVTDKSCLYL